MTSKPYLFLFQYDTLRKNRLEHFDCWASTFGETVTSMEITPDGTGFQQKTRFSRFYNLPELMNMFSRNGKAGTENGKTGNGRFIISRPFAYNSKRLSIDTIRFSNNYSSHFASYEQSLILPRGFHKNL